MAEMMAFPPASHATLKMGHPWELCRGLHGSAGEFLTVYVKPVSRRGLQKRCSSTSGWYLRAASCHAGPCYAVLWYAMLCCGKLCGAMLCCATLRQVLHHHAMVSHAASTPRLLLT